MRDIPRTVYADEHDQFRASFRAWLDNEVIPNHDEWERAGITPRSLWLEAGKHGFLGLTVPEELGGGGTDDYRFAAAMQEEVSASGAIGSAMGFTLHNDIVLPYFLQLCNDEQRQRWLPGMCTGEIITAVAMTEPNAGSDLAGIGATAVRHGDSYLLNGAKTFISNGINSDAVIVVAKTDPAAGRRGITLLVVERGMPGFERGRNLDKLGMHAQDTAELFFNDVEVPAANVLGEVGKGFYALMSNLAQERLGMAVGAIAVCHAALDSTLEYTKSRSAFGQSVSAFQHSKFLLAELSTEVQIGQVYVDRCIELHCAGELSAEQAAAAKFWCTELQNRLVDRCLQLHGGYGYMREYPIARAWADSRIQTIYGGTSEIMREIVGRAVTGGRSASGG
jgi:alkylation response protein AidB-like acyl-CoA dehydrogenase